MDDSLGSLDIDWMRMVLGLINRHANQSIVLCSETVWSWISQFCEKASVIHLPIS